MEWNPISDGLNLNGFGWNSKATLRLEDYLSQFFFQPCQTWKSGKQGSEGFCIKYILSLWLPFLLVPLVICREIIPDVESPAEVK